METNNGKEHLSCTAMLFSSFYPTDQSGFQIRRAHMSPTVLPVSFTGTSCPKRKTKDASLAFCFPQHKWMAVLWPHLFWKGYWELQSWKGWAKAMTRGTIWISALWKKSSYKWGGGWIIDMFHSTYKTRYCWIIWTFPDEEVKGQNCFSSL